MSEVADHQHNKARDSFININGVTQPAPATKFSVSKPETPRAPLPAGSATIDVLKEFGFSESEIESLKDKGALT